MTILCLVMIIAADTVAKGDSSSSNLTSLKSATCNSSGQVVNVIVQGQGSRGGTQGERGETGPQGPRGLRGEIISLHIYT